MRAYGILPRPGIALVLLLLTGLGCGNSPSDFRVNAVHAERLAIEIGEPLPQAGLEDVVAILRHLFGTPDQPRWPAEPDGEIVSLERLGRAAGPVYSDEQDQHFGLYRKHCVRCHGTAGDGLGPAARMLSPYPRDFRLGKFKYKSTPTGLKPARRDLLRTIRQGIPGTSMPSFHLLKEEELQALVDYVIYLTARGELERAAQRTGS